jgi:hypothetical protein
MYRRLTQRSKRRELAQSARSFFVFFTIIHYFPPNRFIEMYGRNAAGEKTALVRHGLHNISCETRSMNDTPPLCVVFPSYIIEAF